MNRKKKKKKKDALKNFAKFTGKHLWRSLVFNKIAGMRPVALLNKETSTQVFCCEFCKIFKNTFFIEPLRWLLLEKYTKTGIVINFDIIPALNENNKKSFKTATCIFFFKIQREYITQKI